MPKLISVPSEPPPAISVQELVEALRTLVEGTSATQAPSYLVWSQASDALYRFDRQQESAAEYYAEIKDPDGLDSLSSELGLEHAEFARFAEFGEIVRIEVQVNRELEIVGGRFIPWDESEDDLPDDDPSASTE